MSRYRDDYGDDCKVYVGDLPKDVSEKELERVFREFGNIRSVWVARNPPGFAFVMFEDERDADDAVRTLDGRYLKIFPLCAAYEMHFSSRIFQEGLTLSPR